MKKNWKRIGLLATVLTLSALMVFAAAALAQGSGPANQAAPAYGQANRFGNSSGGMGPGYGMAARGAWGGPDGSLVAVAAETIGIEQADLVAELQAGATIAEVAADYGVEPQAIVDAFLAPRVVTLDAAVAAGRITQAQADTMLAQMTATVTAKLDQPFSPQGNGTCDGTCSGVPGQGGMGPNWGDGTCDHFGAMQGGRHGGMMGGWSGRGPR